MISAEDLRRIVSYDSKTGIFTRDGRQTGCRRIDGVILIEINCKRYTGHRLAWLYVNGTLPNRIEHINGDKSDNRIANLRIEAKGDQPLTQERLKDLIDYNPETGQITRKAGKFTKQVRQTGLSKRTNGYLTLSVDKKLFAAHRLAWFYVYGTWPAEIDHIDGDRTNNRIANLRPATRSQNNANGKIRKDNTSGHKGVAWDASKRKWVVHVGKKQIGRFVSKEAAIKARLAAAERQFGEFHRAR